MIKLHIGCGKRYLPGYIHIDIESHNHIDHICAIDKLDTLYGESTVDEIYACHILEHLDRNEIQGVIIMLFKILKPSGILRIAVPDIENVIKLYCSGTPLWPTLYGLLWGGQKNEYDFHKCGFDFRTLEMLLKNAGFADIKRYDWREFLPPGYDDYSRSYLPHMDESGELMSLNVQANKPLNKRTITIFSTGGLINAVNSLMTGTYLATHFGLNAQFYWIEGYTALDVDVQNIFDVDCSYIKQLTHNEYIEWCRDRNLIVFCNDTIPELNKSLCTQINPCVSLSEYQRILDSSDKDVYFSCPVQPEWLTTFDTFFKAFSIKDSILKKVKTFLEENTITHGVHIRGTDIMQAVDMSMSDVVRSIEEILQRIPENEKLFVCTDDYNIYKTVQEISNRIILYPRKYEEFVHKRDEGLDWYYNDPVDHANCDKVFYKGKEYKQYSSSNVIRSKEQIIGALVDLLTLSKMGIIMGLKSSNQSTYFHFAVKLGKWRKENSIEYV